MLKQTCQPSANNETVRNHLNMHPRWLYWLIGNMKLRTRFQCGFLDFGRFTLYCVVRNARQHFPLQHPRLKSNGTAKRKKIILIVSFSERLLDRWTYSSPNLSTIRIWYVDPFSSFTIKKIVLVHLSQLRWVSVVKASFDRNMSSPAQLKENGNNIGNKEQRSYLDFMYLLVWTEIILTQ